MASATHIKFGYPLTSVAETDRWSVLLRPNQVTLGSLVLIAKDTARAFGEARPETFSDLAVVVPQVEAMLKSCVNYKKINYLMLMMVDPDVHFHVIPRYAGTREFDGISFPDAGWPGPPDLAAFIALDEERIARLTAHLKRDWTP